MSNFKTMKVFDCQDMPADVRRAFFNHFECGNDAIVEWYISDEKFSTKENPVPGCRDENDPDALEKKKVDAWLIANGAEDAPGPGTGGEHVLIKHWW